MECPRCGKVDPEDAILCDCGFAFNPTSIEQQTPSGTELLGMEPPTALAPHQYPAWIWLMGFGILATLFASLVQLPPYYSAAVLVQRAEARAKRGQDRSAIEFYVSALELAPSSKRARIGLASSYFRSPKVEDHKKALGLLQGITLEKDEWRDLAAVMPAEYQRLFTDVKK
jgi:tetratricopeptide (TPR) repeat protein